MRSRLRVSGKALYKKSANRRQAHQKPSPDEEQKAPQANGSPSYISGRISEAVYTGSGAATLDHVTAGRPSRAQATLLQMQQQLGNRYIQKLVAKSETDRDNTQPSAGVANTIDQMRGKGQPLNDGARAQMEPIFGADFSGVRVNTGMAADRVSRSLNAQAFTIGQDIFFRQGKYNPGSASGRRLLAHELTHVVQQSAAEQTGNGPAKLNRKTGQTGERIQRASDKTSDGSDYVKLTIPDGKYVLEAANILGDADYSLTYTKSLGIYATTSQYKPKKIKGLDAKPHTLMDTSRGIKVSRGEFRIVPGSDLTPQAGKGSAKVQAFRHGYVYDDKMIEAYLRFDTVPVLESPGKTTFVAGNVVDMDPKHHDYVNVTAGSKVGKEETSTVSVSDGISFSATKSVTNTIGTEFTRQLGAELGLEGIGKLTASSGVKLSLQRAVTKAVGTSVTKNIQRTRQVKTTYQFDKPGKYAIVPTCKVWKTPVKVNTFDSSGKVTGQKNGNLYTIIYNQTGSTAKVVGGKVDPNSINP